MLHYLLWPILSVWMGIAVLVLASIVGMLLWGAAHLLRDQAGIKGEVYCPVQHRSFDVTGVPTRFDIGEPVFSELRRCEAFADGHVRCQQACIKHRPAAAA